MSNDLRQISRFTISAFILAATLCTAPVLAQQGVDAEHPLDKFIQVPVFEKGICKEVRFIPRSKPNEVALQYVTVMSSEEEFKAAVTKESFEIYVQDVAATAIKYLGQQHTNSRTDFSLICKVFPDKPTEFWTIVGPASTQSQALVKGMVASLNTIKPLASKNRFDFLVIVSLPGSAPIQPKLITLR